MTNLTPEDKVAFNEYIRKAAAILKKNTAPEILEDFEAIEINLREQIRTQVVPEMAQIFFTLTQNQNPSPRNE